MANGIPIASFKEDPEDQEFVSLIPHLEQCAQEDDVREFNGQKFHLQELFEQPFDNWIDYYYDMEDCQNLLDEERDRAQNDDRFVQHDIAGSTGGRSSVIHKVPVKSVETCLDGLDELMRSNGGKLPIECINEEKYC